MTTLLLHGKPVQTVFHLLGEHENDLTYSLGWALSQSSRFLTSFILTTLKVRPRLDNVTVRLQQAEGNSGITDIEIESPGEFFLIIEAKRGWNLPNRTQLEKYSHRRAFIVKNGFPAKILVLSECNDEYALNHLSTNRINGVEIAPISWKQMTAISVEARRGSTHAERRTLDELSAYLESLMTMQNSDSNRVYVVSLGSDTPEGWKISWIDIVEKKSRYFHPVGGGWPKEPPNYIAFRYRGKLQSIHHIEGYTVFTDPHSRFPDIPSLKWEPHFLYSLSRPFAPAHEVKTGNIYPSGRVWCMLDTLFLAKTISEARDMTKQREQKAE